MFILLSGLVFGFPFSENSALFSERISKVESMVWNQSAQNMAHRHGLDLVNVTWEDTGRSKNSSVGPNISDMTIGVRDENGLLHPMPVYRFSNFTDKTADIKAESFFLRTGNEKGMSLYDTSLVSLVRNIDQYLHNDWNGSQNGVWNKRDSHVLVSAQACLLPIPSHGEAIFTPVLYNYQSSIGNPAVLAIVATREGTSMQVIENDSGYMSQPLYFNKNGERAPFQATRLSDFTQKGGDSISPSSERDSQQNLNAVLVIQVPLKQKNPHRLWNDLAPSVNMGVSKSSAPVYEESDIENAVISHGNVEGPFKELNNLQIERDDRFPIRVTVQFYKATSNGIVTDKDIAEIRKQIDQVYEQGDFVGSLVTDGKTQRPTESKNDSGTIWARPFWSWHKSF